MKITNKFFAILFLLFPFFLLAQEAPIEYGRVSSIEHSIKKSEIDSNANAIILCDYGEINFGAGNMILTRHTRIKILNKNGFDEANIEIPFYTKNDLEKITNIKAHTININEEGKVEKTEIYPHEFFTIDINENWKSKRFTFPNIKSGSIIEYVYSKFSKNVVSLEEWDFQNELPTVKSHLNVLIRDGVDFKIVYSGARLIDKYATESRNSWTLENLQPLEEENFCPNIDNYKESIRFQLASYDSAHRGMHGVYTRKKDVMSDWKQLAKDILDQEDFDKILSQKRKSKKIVNQIISKEDSELEKVKKIYSYVQKNISWDKKYRLFPNQSFSKVLDTKSGNSSEINLCLLRLLRSADIAATPVIISTKNNRMITKVYPLYNQFNHVLVVVSIGSRELLMDAIDPFRPYNLLSKQDLNPEGFILSEHSFGWKKIELPTKTKTIVITELKLTEEEMKYKTSFAFFEHEAAKFREIYHEEKGAETFVTEHLIDFSVEDFELDSFSVKNNLDLEKPFYITCYFEKPMDEGLDADYIYIDPFIKKHFLKNPFIKPNRYLPVDFMIPSSERFIFNLIIPDSYELTDVPDSARFTTENNKSSYNFLYTKSSGNRAQFSSEFIISDPLIFSNEYGSLREMFNQIIKYQSTQIVLKKK